MADCQRGRLIRQCGVSPHAAFAQGRVEQTASTRPAQIAVRMHVVLVGDGHDAVAACASASRSYASVRRAWRRGGPADRRATETILSVARTVSTSRNS